MADPITCPLAVEVTSIARGAELSPCGTYRWTLRRRWAPGPEIGWVMLNPSTADHRQDDPTLRRVIGFTHRWGHGALVVVNLFPRRTPSPAELRDWWGTPAPDHPCDRFIENHQRAVEALKACPILVAAWGALGLWATQPIERWREAADPVRGRDWRCLGRTAGGHPIHPLARGRHRVPDDAQAMRFEPWSSAP